MRRHTYLWRIFTLLLIITQTSTYIVHDNDKIPLLCAKKHKTPMSTDHKIGSLIGLNRRSKDSQTSPILILRNASLWRKDRQILANINLQINPGDRIGIIGNNGAGKSTLIKLIHSCVSNSPVTDALITCDQTIYRGDKLNELGSTVNSERFYFILGIWLSLQMCNSTHSCAKYAIEKFLSDMEGLKFDQFYRIIISKIGNNLNINTCTMADNNKIVHMHQDFRKELNMENTLVTEIARFLQPIFIKERFTRFVSDNIEALQSIADESNDSGVVEHVKNLLNTYNQNGTLINRQFIEYRNRTDKLIKLFELESYKNLQLGHLSTGLIVRSYILLSLLQNPDLMLLDEPTNNLDVKNSEFLAEALKEVVDNHKISVLAVSHDEIFLNRYSNIIWECPGDGSVEIIKGNYDRFINYKNDKIKRVQLRKSRLITLITKLRDKNGDSASAKNFRGAKGTKSDGKRFTEKITNYTKEIEQLRITRGPLELSKYSTLYGKSLQIGECENLFNEKRFKSLQNNELFCKGSPCKFVEGSLLEFRNYTITKSSKQATSSGCDAQTDIISGYSFNIKEGANIAIMGKNGVGKSTLIKSIFRVLDDGFTVTGDVKQAKSNIRINYFPQLHIKLFDTPTEVLKLLLDIANGNISLEGSLYHSLEGYHDFDHKSSNVEGDLKQIMANFHIDDTISNSMICKCSSGEKSRITLSLLFMRDCNLLVLDEPTNHLDTFLKSYLVFLLNNIFEGKFIIITHDEEFIKRLNIHYVLYLLDKNTIYTIDRGTEFIRDYYAQVHSNDFKLREFLEERGTTSIGGSEIKMDSSGERLADVLERREMEREDERIRETKRRASFGGNNISNTPRIKNFNRWK
ncbi:ATP-binding cassette, sub-family F, member 3 [Babesia microti strain RI]|uniref:ATP-binding cassette, sub-family F, member 3 n=1 Tax=Babesia microti (strain RI) TaxID=1133968 RepID=A0A0K3ALX1_BABMR|nr:ATP-binding cassette, sub-family F, member 3 [Babesia microti strain RI]CTQ40739.1 ATP-binding cassette, sub-family F, member 3 [Babesia microti strain RI]|eukprot:XP_012648750.1 ATP-binding cassette, sub-family F, member 3 [Babesia microti strain RI]